MQNETFNYQYQHYYPPLPIIYDMGYRTVNCTFICIADWYISFSHRNVRKKTKNPNKYFPHLKVMFSNFAQKTASCSLLMHDNDKAFWFWRSCLLTQQQDFKVQMWCFGWVVTLCRHAEVWGPSTNHNPTPHPKSNHSATYVSQLIQKLLSPPSLACCRKLNRTVAAWSTLNFSVFWLRVSEREEKHQGWTVIAAPRLFIHDFYQI